MRMCLMLKGNNSRMNNETLSDIFATIRRIRWLLSNTAYYFPQSFVFLSKYGWSFEKSNKILYSQKSQKKFKPHPLRSDQINLFHTKDLVYYKIIQKNCTYKIAKYTINKYFSKNSQNLSKKKKKKQDQTIKTISKRELKQSKRSVLLIHHRDLRVPVRDFWYHNLLIGEVILFPGQVSHSPDGFRFVNIRLAVIHILG